MNLLDKIVREDESGRYYYDIINSSGKEWLLNAEDLKTAFEIYQPTAPKGRILKRIFPYIHKSRFISNSLGITRKKIGLRQELQEVLDNFFGNDYEISYFGGTPSSHQKVILQISHGHNVMAYCKVSDNYNIGRLFDRESDGLIYLSECGINNIPEVIERKTIKELEIFIQSNVKEANFSIENRLAKYSYQFLHTLHSRTKVKLRFAQSDYSQMLNNLKVNCQMLKEKQKKAVITAISCIENRYSDNPYVEFSFYHGDFTPWNAAVCNKKLCVFDFEYCKKTYPPYLDAYHFFVQTEIFIHHSSSDRILKRRRGVCKALECLGIDADFSFKLYLLEIINLYLSRTSCNNDMEIKNMELRLSLLQELNKT